jgi:hypothetical protein
MLKRNIMKRNGFLMNIAHRVPAKATTLLKEAGYPRPTNVDELYSMLEDLSAKNPNKAIPALAKIHPDAKLIIKAYDEWKANSIGIDKNQPANKELEKFASCNGCPSSNAPTLSADAQPEGISKFSNPLIIGGAIVLSVALITLISISRSSK